MSQPASITIPMSRDVKIKVDWRALITNLADVAAQGFATAHGITDGISSGMTALIGAMGSIKIDDDPASKAWRLFWLAFGWSLDELRSTQNIDDTRLRVLVKDALEAARQRVDEGEVAVPSSFLQRPVTLPLYQIVRDEFVVRRSEFRDGGNEPADELTARFDSAFSRAICEIWLRKPEEFKSLSVLLEVPGAAASIFEMQWDSYRQKLIHEFEVKSMFGQEKAKISLSQSYIPLRCSWNTKIKHDEGFESDSSSFAMLEDLLIEWVDGGGSVDKESSDIKLIGGGPGSGKSTSMRRIARVFADRSAIRPLLIPLQHLDLEGGLRDAINTYFTGRTRGSFTTPPLAREAIEDGPRLLLIFDGLDEIARPGEGADEVANLFVTKLDQLLSSLQGDTDQCPKVIITGRMPSFQAAKKFRGALGQAALEVKGYGPLGNHAGDAEIVKMDQRPAWWKKYASVAGLDEKVPAALVDSRLSDVTNEPLLCYLLVLSGFAVDNWESAAENRNLIYQRLVDEVWKRGWGEAGRLKDRQGPGRHLTKSSFNDLMETVALAAWLGGDTRVATEDAFHNALKTTHAEDAWLEFQNDGGEDVANLAMNFYLKAADGNHRGFEFTHKSFGDYLAARALLKLAKEVGNFVPRHTDLALQAWVRGTGTGTLTSEILGYVRDEVRLDLSAGGAAGQAQVLALFSAFETIATTTIDEGLPAHTSASGNWRTVARIQKNSEVMLWGILNSCARVLYSVSGGKRVVVGFEKNRSLFKLFIARLMIGESEGGPIGQCFSHLDVTRSDLFGLNLSRCDFSMSDLSRVNFNGCHLMESNLEGSKLVSTKMQRSNIDNCKFSGADV